MEIEDALNQIGKIVLKGVPETSGYIFYANDVRTVLKQLWTHAYDEGCQDSQQYDFYTA